MQHVRDSTGLSLWLALLALMPATASAASVYTGPPPRPGPELLYAKRPRAPQLGNRRPWKAKPILVSGTTAYRKGEFLYQDFLYDDSGARFSLDPNDPQNRENLFSRHNGTYSYPTDRVYASDAADLVELRVKPLRRATAFRITLNTLKDPSLIAATIAIGGRKGDLRAFPYGANVRAPASWFLTVHPIRKHVRADLSPAGGERLASFRAHVDRRRRQIEVRIPHRFWNPMHRTVRLAAGVGLWNGERNRYLLPQVSADKTHPGGSGGTAAPPAFFNVAFRTHEPLQKVTTGIESVQDPAWWRDRAQAHALAAGDISNFFANVNFGKLARRVRDNSKVPRSGPMDRIYGTHFELSQGVDHSVNCLLMQSMCPGQYQGRLQPYAIYVPREPRPKRGYGMTLLMHSLANGYNQYLGTRYQHQFGERGRGSIVITPEARGPDGGYVDYAEADVFDAWSDVASRYKLDPSWVVATGYSMGGAASFQLAAQFPDLFARIQPAISDGDSSALVPSLRNVPVLMWNNYGDELNPTGWQQTADALNAAGYRYELDAYQPCASTDCYPIFPNHLQLITNDWWAPAARFLGTARVERNPAHVTFARHPGNEQAKIGLVSDHAYWLSAVRLRAGAARGQIDAFSHGFGFGDPERTPTERGTGTLRGGAYGTLIYTFQRQAWGEPPKRPKENRIDVSASGVASATIAVKRARVGCDAKLNIAADGPLAIKLAGCRRTITGR